MLAASSKVICQEFVGQTLRRLRTLWRREAAEHDCQRSGLTGCAAAMNKRDRFGAEEVKHTVHNTPWRRSPVIRSSF